MLKEIQFDLNNIFEIITQNLNSLVIIINKDGELIYISKSVKSILGFDPEELLGDSWWKATRKDTNSAIEMFEYFKELVKTNQVEKLSTERILYDSLGNKKWILWSSSNDKDGNVVSVGYDISKRKQNEKKLKKSNTLLKAKNTEIIDSLNYAQTIQYSILPNLDLFKQYFAAIHVIFEPKDIVSGDFYWYYEHKGLLFVACIDCTGHGVPGALMTILTSNLLKNVIKHLNLTNPSEILEALDQSLFEEFNRNKKIQRADGMDISLCVFDFSLNKVDFSGAFHSLLVKSVDSREIIEYKGKRFPIGLYHDIDKSFETLPINFKKGDQFFLFSDGIVDQFGGKNDKKFTKKRFKELLQSSKFKDLDKEIRATMIKWKGNNEQTDDIVFIGIEI
jgi:PAS domain S-box-containing protein